MWFINATRNLYGKFIADLISTNIDAFNNAEQTKLKQTISNRGVSSVTKCHLLRTKNCCMWFQPTHYKFCCEFSIWKNEIKIFINYSLFCNFTASQKSLFLNHVLPWREISQIYWHIENFSLLNRTNFPREYDNQIKNK